VPIAIRSQQTTISSSAVSTHTVALPTFAAGDRLLLCASFDSPSVRVIDGLNGWRELFQATQSSVFERVMSEADVGMPPLTLTSSVAKQCAFAVYSISGAHASTPSEFVFYDRTDTPFDFDYFWPLLTLAGWSGEETLFIAAVGYDTVGGSDAFPTDDPPYSAGYATLTPFFRTTAFAPSAAFWSQYRVASDDIALPYALKSNVTRLTTNFIVAIRPAAAIAEAPAWGARSLLNGGLN
jgi:hypothetical protein